MDRWVWRVLSFSEFHAQVTRVLTNTAYQLHNSSLCLKHIFLSAEFAGPHALLAKS